MGTLYTSQAPLTTSHLSLSRPPRAQKRVFLRPPSPPVQGLFQHRTSAPRHCSQPTSAQDRLGIRGERPDAWAAARPILQWKPKSRHRQPSHRCDFKVSSSHSKKYKKKQVTLMLMHFMKPNRAKILSTQHVISINTFEIDTCFVFLATRHVGSSSQIRDRTHAGSVASQPLDHQGGLQCVFYNSRTSQFGLFTFQVVSSHR